MVSHHEYRNNVQAVSTAVSSKIFILKNIITCRLKSPVLVFTIVFLFIANAISAHDIALAIYTISQEKNTLKITIEIDKEDLDKVIQINKISIKKYLKKNMNWRVNDKRKSFKINAVEAKGELYYIECTIKRTPKNIQNIQVKNTILIDTVEEHSNVLNFDLNGSERTFRLHKDRVETFFEY